HDTLSLQLGAAATILALLSLFVVARQQIWRTSLVFFQLATLVLIFMMLPNSVWLWDHLPLVAFAQFPWRLLALTALTMAPLAGSIISDLPRPTSDVRNQETRDIGRGALDLQTLLLASLILLSSYPYTTAEIIEPAEGPVSFAG